MIMIDKTPKKPNDMNALTLAYMGDAVYELYIRNYVISTGGRPNVLHHKTISYVSAKAQSRIIHYILPVLTEYEREIVKRGRNAKSYTIPKNTDVIQYRYSTAFEALIGYLYLKKESERLGQIIDMAIQFIERDQNGEKDGK